MTDVHAGVIELRRSHSGFSCTHTLIEEGAASTAAGPGANRKGQVRVTLQRAPPVLREQNFATTTAHF